MASTTLAPPAAATDASHESEPPDSPASRSPEREFLANILHAVLSTDTSWPCHLPEDFAAALLRIDEDGTAGHDGMVDRVAGGVPFYPLYKQLSRALFEWIMKGVFPRTIEPMPGIAEDGSMKAKIDKWTPVVVEIGSRLLELGRGVGYQLHVQEPYFSQLKDGKKTVEGRCASGAYNELKMGDTLLLNQSLLLRVEDVKRYSSFHEMIEAEGLCCILPGVASISEGVQVYRSFYSLERERAGVLGIHVRYPSDLQQPCELLDALLKALHVEGVRTLLGMRYTAGTIDDALPPPVSSLLSAFLSIHHETGVELAGSKLTVGARALAKHVHRSSCGWWGSFTGTEPAKNELAYKKISLIMEQAVWMNVHTLPNEVFEIRVRDGYGARWSADGTQFRGFLEPPMEEGYLHKWRH